MNYEITEEDTKYAELAAHKIAPLFQCFQWQWNDGDFFNPHRTETSMYTPAVQQIEDKFICLIEQFKNGIDTGNEIRLETGRLGIMKDEKGYQLYLTL